LWKNKSEVFQKTGALVLPYFLYFDDFVTDNALGTHAKEHSMASVYFVLPFLPIEVQSKLDNIFLIYLFKSKDKILGNKVIFGPLIDEMKQLEAAGVDILIDGVVTNIRFVLGVIIGRSTLSNSKIFT
jgi:hypothetical protein